MHQITLRKLRTTRDYSVSKVAEYCGVSEEVYQSFEDDCSEMPISIGRKIREFFNIPLQCIFIGLDQKEQKKKTDT